MGDEFRIDSHKLMFHPKEVARWLSGEEIYPIYVEISPSGSCNHRCIFCALDFMGYKPRFLKSDVLKERLSEMGKLGVKSVMYGGEGEPFLHKDLADIIVHTKTAGIDAAVTTNGVLLSKSLSEKILGSVVWIKVSISAGTPETYAKVHRTKPDDFERVIKNLSDAVKVRQDRGLNCTLGAQMILLPENAGEAEILAGRMRETGLNYLVIKPYSQHKMSRTQQYKDIDYSSYDDLKERLSRFDTENFRVIFRERTMKKIKRQKRGYDRCLALPFWAYIDSAGNVWGCSAYLGNEEFRYGDIYNNTFQEIWLGERRKQLMKMVHSKLDASACRINCRMDEINFYLWELTHPSAHVSFI
jgi:radical SAM protein with 4Fe4S-binding SPASM domain